MYITFFLHNVFASPLAMAAKMKQVLERIFEEVQHLQADIIGMTEKCQQRREALEKHCSQTRELFKPWPSKVVQIYCPNNATEEIPETDERSCRASSAEDEKERQELEMLDDILAKAQHVRDIQDKMMKAGKKVNSSLKSSKLQGNSLKTLSSEAKCQAKPKSRVSYPVLNQRPPSAKSTYAASYTKPIRTKTQATGIKKTSSVSKETASGQQKTRKQTEEGKISNIHDTRMSTQNLSKITNPQTARLLQSTECKNRQLDLVKTAPADTKFRISEKGATLRTPTEVQEFCREHKKLLRRAKKAGSFTSRESEEQFLRTLEASFCPTLLALRSFLEMTEDISGLEREYGEVLSLVKSKLMLSTSKRDEMESSSDSLASWGAIMLKFEELNQKALVLKKNLDHLSKYCPFPEHNSSLDMVLGKRDLKYEDKRKLTSSLTKYGQKCLKTDTNGFFTYNNTKELQTLLQVTYEYKMMKYQLHLRKMVGERILPLLQQLPTDYNLFIPLCRSVYSILCCESKTFPTVVKDSFPED